jgi:hypothetical protein
MGCDLPHPEALHANTNCDAAKAIPLPLIRRATISSPTLWQWAHVSRINSSNRQGVQLEGVFLRDDVIAVRMLKILLEQTEILFRITVL